MSGQNKFWYEGVSAKAEAVVCVCSVSSYFENFGKSTMKTPVVETFLVELKAASLSFYFKGLSRGCFFRNFPKFLK